jgi:hypothetical protein
MEGWHTMEGWHNGRLAMEHATHFVGKMLMKKLEREREKESFIRNYAP